MGQIEINFELLDLFNEEEINIVCKNTELALFLTPIKDKRYEKYAKNLGRLDKKSALVQKLLPGIAFKLYKKGEKPFKEAIATQLIWYRDKFIEVLSKRIEPAICVEDVAKYDAKSIAELYFKFLDNSTAYISVDLFFIFLKLQDIIIEETTRHSIEEEIKNIDTARALENKYKAKIHAALKEQEKRLYADFEQKEQKLRRQIEEKNILYSELSEKLKISEQRLQEVENVTLAERKRREAEWLSEYERELAARKRADNIQWEKATSEAEGKYQELLVDLETKAKKRSAELEEQYHMQLKSSKQMLSDEFAELKSKIAGLIEKKVLLDQQIDCLEQRKRELDGYIQKLKNIENKYFDSFEQRIINRKIDTLIFQKLGFENRGDNASRTVPLTIANTSDAFLIPAETFSENVEYGETVSSIEDFFEDYRVNISLNFDNETEIAGVVLASILARMGIVAIDKVCDYLAEALAALLDLSSPLTIIIDSEKESLKALIDVINESDSQVICLKGILDTYNEILFMRLCEICNGKFLFFTVSNLANLKMMSKAMMNYAVVIDVEKELHFPEDDCILIGNHDLKPFIPKLDMRKSREIYKNTFNRLVVNGYIKKSTAIEYSKLLQLYFMIVGGVTLVESIQKGIICACDFCCEDENLMDVLNKSGITVSIE